MNNKRGSAQGWLRWRVAQRRTIIVFESRTIRPKLVDLTSKHSSAHIYLTRQRRGTKPATRFFVTHSFRIGDFTARAALSRPSPVALAVREMRRAKGNT